MKSHHGGHADKNSAAEVHDYFFPNPVFWCLRDFHTIGFYGLDIQCIGGIVITQFDKRKTLNKSVAEIINDSFCDKVFKTLVRDNVALAEAPIKGKNVFEYNKNCNGAKDYMALAQEVLKLK